MKNTLFVLNREITGENMAEIQVIPFGRHDTPKGPFVLDEAGAGEIIHSFEATKNDMVFDYEHQSLADPPIPAPAAGWIKRLINKGADGIWAVVEWTEKARAHLAAKEYKYVSPVFLKRKADNRVIRLINVALTNSPNIDGMVPLVNKSFNGWNRENEKEEANMKNLWKLLGLAEDATEDQAIAVVNKLKEPPPQSVASKVVLKALDLPETATESEATGVIMAMKQSHGAFPDLQTQVNTLSAKLTERDANDAVETAMKEGKVTPAQKEWATEYAKRDLTGFQVFAAKAPVVVVQGQVITEQKPPASAIDEVQAQINKQCGVDDETFKKFGPKNI